jgi:hypothetical protein
VIGDLPLYFCIAEKNSALFRLFSFSNNFGEMHKKQKNNSVEYNKGTSSLSSSRLIPAIHSARLFIQ